VARPFKTFFGHNAVLRSRFHENAPIRKQLAKRKKKAPTPSHRGLVACL
jgi:hypothetical protein